MSYVKERHAYYPARLFVRKSTYSPSIDGQRYGKSVKLVRTRTGDRLANWQQLIAEGKNATTDLTGEWNSAETSDFSGYSRVKLGGAWHILDFVQQPLYDIWPTAAWDNTFVSNAKARASSNFYQAVRKTQVLMSGTTFLGELGETLRMFRRPLAGLQDSIRDYLRKARKAKRGKPQNWTKDLGNLWLEHAFGWTPLLHDIDDARRAYASLFEKERVVRISVGAKDFKKGGDFTEYRTFAGWPSGFRKNYYQYKTYTDVYRYRGAVHAQAATTARDRFARFGFTPSEFIPTAWELLPWSFLVDYFTNIGDILTASVTDTSKLAWINESHVQVIDCYIRAEYERHPPWTAEYSSWINRSGYSHLQRRLVTRTKNTALLLPDLTFRLPRSPWQLLNMTALLAQTNRKVHPQNPRPFTRP